MMKRRVILLFLIIAACSLPLAAQSDRKYVRKGNQAYEKGDFDSAAEAYRRGVNENPYSYPANFNLGNALYEKGEYESAAQQFEQLQQPGMDARQRAKVYHNLGNSFLQQEKYAESIQAYQETLRNNPADADARYNLVYAMQKLREQQDNQEQRNNQQQQQDNQQQQQDGQDDRQQNQDQQQQQDQNRQNQDQQQQPEQQPGQEQQSRPDEISREEAERILQALQVDENQLHQELKKKKQVKGQPAKILKDW